MATLWQIRPRDQRSLATVVLALLFALGGYRVYQHSSGGGVIEFDATEHERALLQVDINRADWPELAQLPGVGETLARRVVEDRQQRGPFRSVEELGRVKGLGGKTLERVMPHVVVTRPSPPP